MADTTPKTPPKADPAPAHPALAEPKPAEVKTEKRDEKADLLTAAQIRAPHLDQAFVDKYDLDDEYLRALARGEISPPPHTTNPEVELHLTPGGWQLTPAGVAPEDVGKDAISR
jgi:hypothetical protein